ncbi:restriction endonuclease subunit S [Aeromonas veronii]|uniref:restriction endonuclease subunit S n=1 Tax=Aeromonas veronii TaxID=654 RepID=UPI003D23ACC7
MNNERLPVGWIEKPLGKLVTFQKGKKTETSDTWQTGYLRYLGASGLQGLEDGYAATSGAVLAGAKDLLMLWDGERSGLVGCAQVGVVASTVAKMAPNDDVLPEYLYYFLDLHFAWIQARRTGTGVPHVPKDLGRILSVRYPSDKDRQKKVVDILQSIDMFIHNTQKQINKLSVTKQGMMADMFSRGIDPASGKLRPSVHDAPELYNDSPLGPVPKAWSLELLKERLNGHGFIQTGPFGSQLHAYDYVDSGVPVVMPQDLLDGEISTDKISYISPDKAETLSRHKLASNDVIFSRRGDLTRSAFVDSDNGYQGFLCGTGCLLMRVKPEVLCAGWFSNLYGTRLVQAQVDGLAVGTTMANLNSSILGKLLLPFPSVSEQQQIHKRLQAVNSQLKVYISELRKLRAQKAGLMRDLLTGKVPVSA